MENARNMNAVFGIALVFLVGRINSGDPEMAVSELSNIYQRLEKFQCYKIFSITNEMRAYARKGIFPNTMFNCYLKCMLYALGVTDDLGQVYEDTLRPFFPQNEQLLVDRIVRVCLPQPEKTYEEEYNCDTLTDFVKCCYNVNPRTLEYLPI